MTLEFALCTLLAAIAAPHLLYPVWLAARAFVRADPVRPGDALPEVDLVICAHDEAAAIGARLENALALDYPPERLRIWLASDGSRDGTVEIARRFEDPRLVVLDLPRMGKAAALGEAVARGRAEVIAFSDANSDWQPDALRALVRPFSDPRVGGVAGDQRYVTPGTEDRAAGERGYWSFDRMLKRWQARSGSIISATGAIYAVRRALFEPPPSDATDDFMVSTGVIARGHRLAFAEDAIATEPPAGDDRKEFRRKVRIITRGLTAVSHRRALLDPRRSGAYAVDLLLHKVWRRLVWIPGLGLLALLPACLARGDWLAGLAAAAGLGLGLGIAGWLRPGLTRFRPVAIASWVLMVNSACAVACWNRARGRRVTRWDSQREESADPDARESAA